MNCRLAQELILDNSDQRDLLAHLVTCPTCAAFAAKQTALDAQLKAVLAPPNLSPRFRTELRRRIRREIPAPWTDSTPGIVQLLSCGAVTIVSAVLLPFSSSLVFAAGAAATAFSYVVLTVVQSAFEELDDRNEDQIHASFQFEAE
jgi:anti-sigma factor RsiW